ncbi:MAG: hypothetical protein COV45_08960 [Deltaproteobacteria bacterium CG11_big_fil_rev_8_21_14_0_20_47_16]|nr:MAG: hypothetical protein COV45_08960 [Deltaproteobacteria bacterium CG11_big_fil_rev_8_21_14_0_20_47_16]
MCRSRLHAGVTIVILLLEISCGGTANNSTVTTVNSDNGSVTYGIPATTSVDGITTDMCGTVACTEGATPGTTPTAPYSGFPSNITAPTVSSIVVNSTYTMSTSGNNSFPLRGSGSSYDSFVITFDEAMLTDQEAGSSGVPVDAADIDFLCTGDDSTQNRVSGATIQYSTSTTLAFSLRATLPADTACTLVLNGAENGIGGTQRIRDQYHNPLIKTTYTINTGCGVSDDFSNGLSCWTAVNTDNGTFSASSSVLTLSIPGAVTSTAAGQSPTAAGLLKTGIRKLAEADYMRFGITIDSITGFLNDGDGVGLRVSDPDGNYIVFMVSSDAGTNKYRALYGTTSTDTDTFYASTYTAGDEMYIQLTATTVSIVFDDGAGGGGTVANISLAMDLTDLDVQILGMKNGSGTASTVTMSNFYGTFAE